MPTAGDIDNGQPTGTANSNAIGSDGGVCPRIDSSLRLL